MSDNSTETPSPQHKNISPQEKRPTPQPEDHDSPWKEALEDFFQSFLQLLYPDIHDAIDWQQPITFLDKELQKPAPDSHASRRHVDKLVQVAFHDQRPRWLLIHIEVQGQRQTNFPERMFTYYHRLREHHGKAVISLAVLADTNPRYRPDHFEEIIAGSGIRFHFRTVKLLDFRNRMDELRASDNPFALLVAAQLVAKLEKSGNRRVDNLTGFYRLAFKKGMSREQLERLLLFLDWMIALPPESEAYYTEQMDRLKKENAMPYVSMLERVATKRGIEQGIERGIEQGIERGIEQGIERGIEQGIQTGLREGQLEGRAAMLSRQLQLKFGDLPETLQQRLTQASEAELDLWAERILFADSLEQVIG